MTTAFRRAFLDHYNVCVETAPGEFWFLPNPTEDGRHYDRDRVLAAVIASKKIDLEKWKRMTMP
jgi:hypothetical protein